MTKKSNDGQFWIYLSIFLISASFLTFAIGHGFYDHSELESNIKFDKFIQSNKIEELQTQFKGYKEVCVKNKTIEKSSERLIDLPCMKNKCSEYCEKEFVFNPEKCTDLNNIENCYYDYYYKYFAVCYRDCDTYGFELYHNTPETIDLANKTGCLTPAIKWKETVCTEYQLIKEA
jgi:hypothetical protein